MNRGRQAPDLYAKFAVYDKPAYFNQLHETEWRGQLQSSTGGRLFRIKYYDSLFKWEIKPTPQHIVHHQQHYGRHFNGLVAGSDRAPELLFAIDIHSGEEILLFDGGRHGYSNLFCDTWEPRQLTNRMPSKFYTDSRGNQEFEIVVQAFFNVDYEEELDSFRDESGTLRLISGEKTNLGYLLRNGFDAISIKGYDRQGDFVAIHSAELA